MLLHAAQNVTSGLVANLLGASDAVHSRQGCQRSQERLRNMSNLIGISTVGIVSAGHETTSMALMWTFYLLAQHPHVEQKLHAEVDRVLGGHLPTVTDIDQLTYTRMVLQEVLRLYPPAYITARQAVDADQLHGHTIPAGAKLILNLYGMQRHAAYWPEPQRFDPEHFAPEQ